MSLTHDHEGRWPEILTTLGVSPSVLSGKHQPCPVCGGKDRFRFTDRNGSGSYICSGCGNGNGYSLLMKLNDWSFEDARSRVREIVARPGNPTVRVEKQIDTRAAALEILKGSMSIQAGDPAWLYLCSRGIKTETTELKYVPELYCSETESSHPAMVGLVRDVKGVGQTLHRTYLKSSGEKADVKQPRKLMPGEFPKGGAIRLGHAAARMGVAEGIETALSASVIGGMPVWSTVSEGLLQSWQPPEEAKEIFIWSDHDKNHVGQCAAEILAKRLFFECGVAAKVMIPDQTGTDWNDVLLRDFSNARAA